MSKWCCMQLRSAGIVAGYCGTLISALVIIFISISLHGVSKNPSFFDQTICRYDWTSCFGELHILTIYLLIALVYLVVYLLLTYGTIKEDPVFLLPFLVVKAVSLIFGFLYTIFAWITWAYYLDEMWEMEIIHVLLYVFLFYIWCVILMLFKELRNQKDLQKWAEMQAHAADEPHKFSPYEYKV